MLYLQFEHLLKGNFHKDDNCYALTKTEFGGQLAVYR